MNKRSIIAGLVAFGFLAGCDSNRDNVNEARRDLQKTEQKAGEEVRETQAEAVKDINESKEEAAADVREARKDLQEAQKEVIKDGETTSGTTTSGATTAGNNNAEVRVTKEECIRLAKEKTVRTEDRAKHEACSKMKTDEIAK